MDKDEKDFELYKVRESSIEKYISYLMALSVAAIAYSIDITKDDKLSLETIFILLAIISWGISFWNGSSYIINSIHVIALNRELLKTEDNSTKEILKRKIKITGEYFPIQRLSFIIGIGCFVLWYVLHLYLNGSSCNY